MRCDLLWLIICFSHSVTDEDKEMYWAFLVAKSENDLSYSRKYYLWEFGEERIEDTEMAA